MKLVDSTQVNGRIPVEKYRSEEFGMTAVIAQVDGPVVNGYFCLATEALDDDGLPHTLEHLIFLGSEKYPYKGVLDLLANRCLSSGTNAWTDTDHTCYTMTTAGSEGFLQLLPVYLDHVLYPTLTDEGFVTEVHHVDGIGEDGGVVYCEMQGCENTAENKTHLAMLRAMYPGQCGYSSETGGIMGNLRTSTTNKKVRDYHREFYRPENLCLIITGQIDPQKVFAAIDDFLQKIKLKEGSGRPYTRPWQSPVPPLEASKDLEVPYPTDEEDNGLIYIAWRGPNITTDLKSMFAMMILMEYLTESSVSPLQAAFVEIDDPLASSVGYSFIENSESTVYLIFRDVPREKMEKVELELKTVLDSIVSGKMAWDKERLKTVLDRRILEQISQVENSPHDAVAFMAIGDMLYGNNSSDFHKRLNSVAEYKELETESDSFWIELLKRFLIGQHRILVKGVPSKRLEEQMKQDEKQRIKTQKESIGEAGLKVKGDVLAAATEMNGRPAPDDMLRSFSVPSAASIEFHPVKSVSTSSEEQLPGLQLSRMPAFTQFDQVSSDFVYMFTLLNTKDVSPQLKNYLPLLLELLVESPIQDGPEYIAHEDVVTRLNQDFLSSTARLGLGGRRFVPGSFGQAAVLYMQTQPQKYRTAVDWIRKLLYCTKFTAERIRVTATKMENSIAAVKRSGHSMVSILLNQLVFKENSNIKAASILNQQSFLKDLLKQLDAEPDKIVSGLEEVRASLTRPDNIMVHIAADLELLKSQGNPVDPWSNLFPACLPYPQARPDIVADVCLSETNCQDHVLAPLGSSESSFLIRCVPAIVKADDPDLAPLLLFLQYLTVCEGPMWREIRGQGLAYGYSMYPNINKGQLYLSLYRATHPVRAYNQAKSIAMSYVAGVGDTEFDRTLLESAKSSLIFELIEKEKTIAEVVSESLISSLKGVDKEFNRKFLQSIDAVTVEDLNRVGVKYIPPLFDGSAARTAIVCPPGKVAEYKDGFASEGLELRVLDSLDSC